MSHRVEPRPAVEVTDALLSGWSLPDPGSSKNSRGRVVVIGGSAVAPGAVMLSGLAALRVGAGRLSVVVPPASASTVAAAVPEAGVFELDGRGRLSSEVRQEVRTASAVLLGPGLMDFAQTERLLKEVSAELAAETPLVLDAFALGVIGKRRRGPRHGVLLLNPNLDETARLLGREIENLDSDVAEVAGNFNAVVSSQACVAAPDGRVWRIRNGGPGLGTSGSGDVLAGAIAGFAARGVDAAEAAVWASQVHASAGDWLAHRIAPLGFLARELCDELAPALAAIEE
ncbi:NAD(P)H-hydrate dehydratase [Rathayibacter sp. YIM 133350]|uniref:NAD(P)H-hydrate dehydratase n=1 Tax=Rathayibacter sp. YIM 133350 TaxID=3131992 RepID=UPI00307F782F